jgi:hypothetical protein
MAPLTSRESEGVYVANERVKDEHHLAPLSALVERQKKLLHSTKLHLEVSPIPTLKYTADPLKSPTIALF